jgi:hypothetical protein
VSSPPIRPPAWARARSGLGIAALRSAWPAWLPRCRLCCRPSAWWAAWWRSAGRGRAVRGRSGGTANPGRPPAWSADPRLAVGIVFGGPVGHVRGQQHRRLACSITAGQGQRARAGRGLHAQFARGSADARRPGSALAAQPDHAADGVVHPDGGPEPLSCRGQRRAPAAGGSRVPQFRRRGAATFAYIGRAGAEREAVMAAQAAGEHDLEGRLTG